MSRILQTFAIGFVVISAACTTIENETVVVETEAKEQFPDQEIEPFEIELTNVGIKVAYISSKKMLSYTKQDEMSLEGDVKADFFSNEGKHSSKMVSERALINEKRNLMKAFGNVIVESDSGITLFTDTLFWNSDREHLFTDDSVMFIREDGDTLYGVGFTSDRSLKNWEIKQTTGIHYRVIK